MTLKNCLPVILLLFVTTIIYSQDPVDIEIDRLGNTISPLTMKQGSLQAELGGGFWESSRDYSIKMYTETITQTDCMLLMNNPVFTLRYGLLNNVELRLGGSFNLESHKYRYDKDILLFPNTSVRYAWGPLLAGLKVKFLKGAGLVPASALLLNLSIPAGNFYLHTDYVSPEVKLAFKNRLSEKFSLGYNFGYGWNLYNGFTETYGTYAVSVSYILTKKITAFTETYGILEDGKTPSLKCGAGFSYLIAGNVKVNLSGGLGISERAGDYSLGAGVSLRLPE